jgi:hypothetical protein
MNKIVNVILGSGGRQGVRGDKNNTTTCPVVKITLFAKYV